MPQPFPFIVSVGRSGTTLLRAMLERHPELAIPPESYFPFSLAARHGTAERLNQEELLRDLEANPRFRAWGLAPDAARKAVMNAADYPGALRGLYASYARARGKTRYADKTPAFLLRMGELDRLFPESVFVHLVRDGRDVAASLLETSFGPSSLGQAAVLWHRWNERGAISGATLGQDRYLVVRYEDLVAQPEATLRLVCGFIDLDFRPEMLEHRGADTHLPPAEAAHHDSLARPLTLHIRDWRTTMSSSDTALFEAVAGPTLDRFNYERTGVRVGPGTRARAVWEWIAFDVHSNVRRAGRELKARIRRPSARDGRG